MELRFCYSKVFHFPIRRDILKYNVYKLIEVKLRHEKRKTTKDQATPVPLSLFFPRFWSLMHVFYNKKALAPASAFLNDVFRCRGT